MHEGAERRSPIKADENPEIGHGFPSPLPLGAAFATIAINDMKIPANLRQSNNEHPFDERLEIFEKHTITCIYTDTSLRTSHEGALARELVELRGPSSHSHCLCPSLRSDP